MRKIIAIIATILGLCSLAPAQTTQPSLGQQVDSILAAEQAQIFAAQAQVAALQKQLANPACVAPGTDLATLPSARRYLQPVATYAYNSTGAQITGGGFVGYGSVVSLKPVAGGSSGLFVHGPNVEIGGVKLAGPAFAIRAIGDDPSKGNPAPGYWFHDLSFDGSLSGGIDLEQWADSTRISHCNFGIIGAQGIYCTADDLTLNDCTFAGSQGEHCLRLDMNATTKHRPANLLVNHCTFTNPIPGKPTNNPTGKECVALRECDGAILRDCDFYGWVDVGQGTPPATDTNWHARHIVFLNCRWHTLRPGGALLQVRHDSTVTLAGCTFPGSASDLAIMPDARSTVTLRGCSQSVTPGLNPKPLIQFPNPDPTVTIHLVAPTTQS